MKTFFLLLLLAGACHRTPPATSPTAATGGQPACIDSAKISKDAMCTAQYDPVCGCDGKTYSNACVATNAGLTRFTKGACPGQD